MLHRHLDLDPDLPADRLPKDALDDLLERGGFDEWAPLVRAIRSNPRGPLAETVLGLCRDHPMYGTSVLWTTWIDGLRRTTRPPTAMTLAELRASRSVTQQSIAEHLGTGQSDVSKIERRPDLRLSTLARYLDALGADLELAARLPGGARIALRLPWVDQTDDGRRDQEGTD